jgi:hypothetical protein
MFHCNRYPSWFHIHVNFGVRANTDEVAAHGLDQYRHPAVATKTGGVSPAFWLLAVGCWLLLSGSAQQLQHALLRLVGERERGDRDRLAGRQRLAAYHTVPAALPVR